MFYAHALREKWGIPSKHMHIKNSAVGSMLAMYGSTMHVATL